MIQYTFECHPAQVFRMISGQCRQLFDCQIVIDSDGVPRMDHSAVPKTYAAMSPVDRTVFAWTQAVIEYERTSFRHSAPQRVLVQLARFLCAVPAEYFDIIADFKCVLDKRKTPACILCTAKFALCEILDDTQFAFSFLVKDESILIFYDAIA